MLGDLKQNLQAVGRLDVFDAIGDKALDYFESLPEKNLTSRTLAQRADALTLIGENAFDRADLAGAVRAFTQSVQQARMLADREPDSGSWQSQLATSELWLGLAYWQQGRLDDATDHFRLALAAAERAHVLAPGDIDVLGLARARTATSPRCWSGAANCPPPGGSTRRCSNCSSNCSDRTPTTPTGRPRSGSRTTRWASSTCGSGGSIPRGNTTPGIWS